jgi:GNAT superfamily N-acetyltransferase
MHHEQAAPLTTTTLEGDSNGLWCIEANAHERNPQSGRYLSFVVDQSVDYPSDGPMNTNMNVRKLLPSEAVNLWDHLCRLTREQRSLRFMGALDDVAVGAHCEELDWLRTVVIGFFDAGVLRGAAELQVTDEHFPILYEVAISVEAAWQDRGVATELLRRALVVARNRSARGVELNCAGDNHRIQHVARKFGARFRCASGECEAEIPTSAPTYWSLCEEALDDGLGWLNFWFDPRPRSMMPRDISV